MSEAAAKPLQVKICGITSVDDALAGVAAGTDAIGLNFYSNSSRCVSIEQAQQIAAAMPAHIQLVGVFVNHSAGEIAKIVGRVPRLDMIQLHGHEPPAIAAEIGKLFSRRPIVRALRLSVANQAEADQYIRECVELGALPSYLLIDSYDPQAFGGTGQVADWSLARSFMRDLDLGDSVTPQPGLILAGGLCPDNVAQAIDSVRPLAVDVASGVESTPGRKDADKMRRFVAAARAAFAGRGQTA